MSEPSSSTPAGTARPWRWAAVLALAVLAGVMVPPVALAQAPAPVEGPGQTWSFAPTRGGAGPGRTWFILELQPGQVLRDSVTLSNYTDRPISFSLYPADAFNSANAGDFTIRAPEEPREGVARWVSLAVEAYTAQPGERVTIPFEVRVPTNASPGDHIGAIAAKTVNPETTSRSAGVAVEIMRAIGARLYLRVAGALQPGLRVDDVVVDVDAPLWPPLGDRRATVRYQVSNPGNIRVSARASVRVTGPFGRTLFERRDIDIAELLPGNSVTLTEEIDDLPFLGPIEVDIGVEGPDAGADESATAWIIPWLLVALVLVVLVGLLAWWLRRRRRRRRQGTPPVAPDGPPGMREPVMQ
jgi:hypothetical protein